MPVHVAIVSEQLLPTVIPCLMARPERVVLVASRAMAARAKRLQGVLREHGLLADIHGEPAPDYKIEAVRAYARKLAESLGVRHAGAELVFNATGGTKLMTLGFVEVLRERAGRIIYTDTAHAQIEVIYDRRTAQPAPEPMPDVLDVPGYLAVQGFRYEQDASRDRAWMPRMQARRGAAKYLAQHAARLEGLVATLNALTQKALDARTGDLTTPAQRLREPPRGLWPATLRELDQAGVLRWSGDTMIRFPDAEGAQFLRGGWLEEYAFSVAEEAKLYDVRLNVRGAWEGAATARNEFDVLACHRNRLLFIECKTLKFDEGPNDNDLAYKVESLGKDARGLFGDIWVVTAREPTPVLMDRARQAGFHIIGPKLLGTLPQWVNLWKKGRSPT